MTGTMPARVVNAMSVDVEDYYQVSAFAGTIPRAEWDRWPDRVGTSTRACLALFAERDVRATFFVLGCVARRHPDLIREIVAGGHELASHGMSHHRVWELSPAEFRADVRDTRLLLEDLGGVPVRGYRAPSFSIDRRCWWAYEMLAEAGYAYSSSIHPIAHDHYGMPDAPRGPFEPGSGITEIPVGTVELGDRRFSCAGGGFFRLLPYAWSRWGIGRVNGAEGRPVAFYFHPWEIDPGQPRVPGAPLRSRLRHYTNLGRMEAKLRRLLRDFAWDRMDVVHGTAQPLAEPLKVA
ncbi:XrtA system polysaccharide deacetylase [Arenibaculum pallidiluteum]|uniref:XrtA system polysaccharide deacetylase n=1 Tax=Arenibaculum pallidiluteum TaxID=2812559 RepID=UPI001F32922B|nr:XrtA system polysaccharide deacetylase [Arenibaculum pallidiluteum]